MPQHDEAHAFAFGRVRRIFDTLFMLNRLASADEGEAIGPLPPLRQLLKLIQE
jgi:hypothetical protein